MAAGGHVEHIKMAICCYRPANAISAMFQSSMGLSETADLMVKLLVTKIMDGSRLGYRKIAMSL